MEQTKEIEQHELHRQLELQRQYLDFLANSIEYLVQEIGKVKSHLVPINSASSIWHDEVAMPHRPVQLGVSRRCVSSGGNSF